ASTDPEHPGRRRSHRAVFAEHAPPRCVDESGRNQRARHDSWRRPRQLQTGSAIDGLREDPRVSREERTRAEKLVRLVDRQLDTVDVLRKNYFELVSDLTHELMMSIGSGNTTVVFFSTPISVSVCR